MFKGEYSDYPFSKLSINGKTLFKSANDFLDSSLEKFCSQIKTYINQQIKLEIDIDMRYKYIYLFNFVNEERSSCIDYYYIEYIEANSSSEVEIVVTPPKNISKFNIKPYYGNLKYQKNRIIITFENENDYISMLFNRELINSDNEYLIGVGTGISNYNYMIPISKKVILSREIIKDVSELYLTLNETEILIAKENTFKLNYQNISSFKQNHLEKYVDKVEKLDRLFRTLSREDDFGLFYEQLAFKEFSSLYSIFQKIQQKHSYFINYRKRIFDILLQSYKQEQYKSIFIVMPIFVDDNIFEHLSPKALEFQEEFITLSKEVKISIIFVLKDCKEPLNDEFSSILEKLSKQINISFSFKSKLENLVNSIDFLYTDRQNFLVSKSLRVDNPVFNLSINKSTIAEYETMYKKIVNRSITYKAFIQGNYKKYIRKG